MGIGVITGAIAIARTATAYQVKSEDLLWVVIPNTGNITAYVPILKPFVRYAHAKATGKHPKGILLRKSIAPQPSRWYTREFWSRRRSSPVYDKEANSHPLPAGVTMAPRAVQDVDTSNGTERTLGLPLQGIREGHQSDDSMPDFDAWLAKCGEDERNLRKKRERKEFAARFRAAVRCERHHLSRSGQVRCRNLNDDNMKFDVMKHFGTCRSLKRFAPCEKFKVNFDLSHSRSLF